MWHTSIGKIVYDPYRGQMKNKIAWWCVAEVDKEITRYHRWWIYKKYGIELCQPSWDAHISIIRGEAAVSDKLDLWKKYDGKLIEFDY